MFTCLQWLHPKVDAVDSRKAGPFDSLRQPVCFKKCLVGDSPNSLKKVEIGKIRS